jgi:hypothetical protein
MEKKQKKWERKQEKEHNGEEIDGSWRTRAREKMRQRNSNNGIKIEINTRREKRRD